MVSIGVCLVVKNEATRLPRALDSVAKCADELVVVDTGSTDQTISTAKDHGARVISFPWCDDFSAAINVAHRAVTSDWILRLDGDEWLAPGVDEQIRRLVTDDVDAVGFLLRRRDLTHAGRTDLFTEQWVDRLLRRQALGTVVGRCHAQFSPSLDQVAERHGLRLKTSDLVMLHDGYAGGISVARLERAKRLIELELADRPGQLYYRIELGRTLLRLNDPRGKGVLDDAVREMLAMRDRSAAPFALMAALIEYALVSDENDVARRLALKWFPAAAPLRFRLAQLDYSAGDFSGAVAHLRAVQQHAVDGTLDRGISFDPGILGDPLWLNLGSCHVRLAQLDEAEKCFRQIDPRGPHAQAAAANLAEVDRLRGLFQNETGP